MEQRDKPKTLADVARRAYEDEEFFNRVLADPRGEEMSGMDEAHQQVLADLVQVHGKALRRYKDGLRELNEMVDIHPAHVWPMGVWIPTRRH